MKLFYFSLLLLPLMICSVGFAQSETATGGAASEKDPYAKLRESFKNSREYRHGLDKQPGANGEESIRMVTPEELGQFTGSPPKREDVPEWVKQCDRMARHIKLGPYPNKHHVQGYAYEEHQERARNMKSQNATRRSLREAMGELDDLSFLTKKFSYLQKHLERGGAQFAFDPESRTSSAGNKKGSILSQHEVEANLRDAMCFCSGKDEKLTAAIDAAKKGIINNEHIKMKEDGDGMKSQQDVKVRTLTEQDLKCKVVPTA